MGDLQNETSTDVTESPTDFKIETISHGELPIASAGPPEIWKTGGRLLSGLLGINVVLLGCALISSGAFYEVSVVEREVLSFLSVLMGLSGCWMVIYLVWTSRHPHNLNLKDSHAGPIWLRGGLAVFGVCNLVLDVMKIGKSVSLAHCESPVKLVHPVIQGMFVVIQTYFLWVSCKDCVQIHLNLTRCGLMLTLSTNLAVWMAAVTDESLHQTVVLETDPSKDNQTDNITGGMRASSGGSHGCDCVTTVCQALERGYYYLYPFNIEYSLFASALTYVMWKNVGRLMSQQAHHTAHTFHARSLFVGLVCGIGIFVAGLAIFIVYEIEVSSEETRTQSLTMFYIFNIVALSLMSIGSLTGSIIYRFDKRDMDKHKNPTRTLDVVLLLGAALGQYFISYYSIVAMVATSPGGLLNTLNLVYALLMIVQHTFQNAFIIEGLHKQPAHHGHSEQHGSVVLQENSFIDHVYINPAATVSHSSHPGPIHENHGNGVDTSHHRTPTSSTARPDWRRKVLREISLFLLLSNIIFWIMPAFGARPQFDNQIELNFYGYSMWVAIVNIGLPFGIFYRMHAVASLIEVYASWYSRTREQENSQECIYVMDLFNLLDMRAADRGQSVAPEGPKITYEWSWLHRHCTSVLTHHQRAQKSGRLFSGLLAINVIFLGAGLVSSVFLSKGAVPALDWQIFLSLLMLLSSVWALFHLLYTRKIEQVVLLQDHHAGALWLQASLTLFGIFSLLLSIFKIGHDVVLLECKLPMEIFFSSMQMLFIIAQTCLLWFSCKDCVQVLHNVTRFLEIAHVHGYLSLGEEERSDDDVGYLALGVKERSDDVAGYLSLGEEERNDDDVVDLPLWEEEESDDVAGYLSLGEEERSDDVDGYLTLWEEEKSDDIARCGIMLTLATNVVLWLLAVIDDSVHRELESAELNSTSDESGSCKCPKFSKCWTFQQGYVTLYPFNLEYSLICASMLYVMWKNVGRRELPPSSSHQPSFRLQGVIYGPLLGGGILLVGICVFIQYQVQASAGTVSPASFLIYYSYSITLLSVMVICCVVGIIIHSLREKDKGKHRENEQDGNGENSRKLGEIGAYMQSNEENGREYGHGNIEEQGNCHQHRQDENISDPMQGQMVRSESRHQLVEKGKHWQGEKVEYRQSENYGEPQEEEHKEENVDSRQSQRETHRKTSRGATELEKHRNLSVRVSHKNYTRRLDIILLLGSALGQFSISYFSIIATVATNSWDQLNSLNLSYSVLMILQYLFQTIFIIEGMRGEHKESSHPQEDKEGTEEQHMPRRMSLLEIRRVSLAYLQNVGRLSVSRRAVKETTLFMVFCNIMFWIMSAFGAHPHYTNGLERQFYGSSVWFSILNFGLPLSVFYRMHSVSGLLEVYISA
ncbi:uncharacterized protein WCC33_015970 [Rhinophrynus dorsalis]